MPVNEAASAQTFSAIERSLQRPPLPNNRPDLILQPAHTITMDGQRFLLIDDGAADRILVFATDEMGCKKWIVC